MWPFMFDPLRGKTFDRFSEGGGGGGGDDDPNNDLDPGGSGDGADDDGGSPNDTGADEDLIVDDDDGGDAGEDFRSYFKEQTGMDLPDGVDDMDSYLKYSAQNRQAPERSGGEIDHEKLATAIAKALAPAFGDRSDKGEDKEELPDLSFPSLMAVVDDAFKSGKITEKDVHTDYRDFASVIEPAFQKVFAGHAAMFKRQEAALEKMSTVIVGLGSYLKGMKDTGQSSQFKQFATQYPGFKREDLDAVIANNKDITTYREAAEFMVWRNPKLKHLLERVTKKTDDDKKRRKEGFSRFRKGGGKGPQPVSWRKYTLPGGNLDKTKLKEDLAAKRISQAQYQKICDKHIELMQRAAG